MSLRFQRLLLIFLSLIFLTASIFLILFNSKKNLIFFYTPSELLNSDIKINTKVRLGGFVKAKSLINSSENQYEFIIDDNKNSIKVSYKGLLPDLFREGQGVVVEGIFLENNFIKATTVFAKHDENYMPASVKKQLQDKQYWDKQY